MSSSAARIPDYTVVIACFNEEQSIEEFFSRLLKTIRGIDAAFEVVFVDDGSRDGTFARLLDLFEREDVVTAVLQLFSNSGQAAAITAGMNAARGRNFVLIDSDLQLDPEELPALITSFREGNDIVSGYRANRRDNIQRRLYSWIANAIIRRSSRASLRDFGCTFKIFDGRLVRAFAFGPTNVFRLLDVVIRAGRSAEVPVSHHPRRYGRSGWTLGRLLDLNTENLLMLLNRPFQYVGLAAAAGGLLLIARVLLDTVYAVHVLKDVTGGLLLNAIIVTLLVTAAIQALIGELVIRSFLSLRATPAYVVKELVTRESRVEAIGQSIDAAGRIVKC
jgi:glycosyltransferase involved in cell wall biosynthesis